MTEHTCIICGYPISGSPFCMDDKLEKWHTGCYPHPELVHKQYIYIDEAFDSDIVGKLLKGRK
jgi:hypothetical protein